MINVESQTEITSVARDLSPYGCFVTGKTPFPKGTVVRLKITNSKANFSAVGQVALFSSPTAAPRRAARAPGGSPHDIRGARLAIWTLGTLSRVAGTSDRVYQHSEGPQHLAVFAAVLVERSYTGRPASRTHHLIFIVSIYFVEAGRTLAAFVEPLVFAEAVIFLEAPALAVVLGPSTRIMFIMPRSSWPRMWQ